MNNIIEKKSPLVTINIVVYNGEKYLRYCLNRVKAQTYQNIEVNILDNASTDATRRIVENGYPEFNLIPQRTNLGMWPGQEEALRYSHGKYIVSLSVDVLIDPKFIERAVKACERDNAIGALQAKIYQYDFDQLLDGSYRQSKTIDTCGFKVFRSRKIGNLGHGENDYGQYDMGMEVFAVEGAVPFFRREALDAVRIQGTIIDHDYFWYGDDLDLTWRMRIFGWKQWFAPDVIAYHDRSTTKGHSHGMVDYFRRIKKRQQIPSQKRILDWSNVLFTIVKNDYIINVLKDLPFILTRQVQTLGYWLLFEPRTFGAIPRFFRLLPKMLEKRKLVMRQARVNPQTIHQWFR